MSNSATPISRVAILTLGCKLNQADSEAIARELLARGCEVIDRPAAADAFVINTCSVTHVADRKARHLARRARRLSPGAPVIVTGCYVETAGPDLGRGVDADLVVKNDEKPSLARLLLDAGLSSAVCCRGSCDPLRARAFVKVQEGCNDVCSFCIVPRTRGRERSVAVDEVVAAVRAREEDGVREVVLTGTQLGAYGSDGSGGGTERAGPAVLLSALLAETSVPRLRLSSLQPQDVTPELLSLWQDPRLCRHFHIALQSGSDAVLSRMRRRYTIQHFRRVLALIREHLPDAAVTTDVMIGFPGESDADFEDTCAFCLEAGFAKLHVFPYSRRPQTAAARMTDQVPEAVKRTRTQRLLGLAETVQARFQDRFLGRVMPVLWEKARATGAGLMWEGLTDNYLRVFARSDGDLSNRLLPVRLVGRDRVGGGLWGELA